MEHPTPGVYIEDNEREVKPIEGVSTVLRVFLVRQNEVRLLQN